MRLGGRGILRGGRRLLAVSVLCAAAAVPRPAAAESADLVLGQFFSIWDDDARVTPQAVRALYGDRVSYYGQSMTSAQVYANKRAFIRRWPERHYRVVPGSAQKGCDAYESRCAVSVTLAWSAESGPRRAAARGRTRVSLVLARQAGDLKIVSESGRPVGRLDSD